MKVKTAELTGVALDYAVAMIEKPGITGVAPDGFLRGMPAKPFGDPVIYSPSTNWAQGGPIIERENIWVRDVNAHVAPAVAHLNTNPNTRCVAQMYCGQSFNAYGPTLLIAAMRCYVASKLGDEVEVPDDLVNA